MLTELPGAETVLAVLKLISRHDQSSYFHFGYTEHKWDNDLRKHVPAEPRFVVSADCSDTFFWGSADAEPVTPENLPILAQTISELAPLESAAYARLRGPEGKALEAERSAAHDAYKASHPKDRDEHGNTPGWSKSEEFKALRAKDIRPDSYFPASELFSARVRGMRPQGACYSGYAREIWPLFNACGPERETGFGNPRPIPALALQNPHRAETIRQTILYGLSIASAAPAVPTEEPND